RSAFLRDGVVIIEDFFSSSELADVNAEMDRHYAAKDRHHKHKENFHDFSCDIIGWSPIEENNEAFLRLQNSEKLIRATRAALGGDFVRMNSLVMFCRPRGMGQAWHQDCQGGDPGNYNLNRLIYARDVRPEAGSVVCVPGSHVGPELPPGEKQEDLPGQLVLSPKAGTLVLLHGRCYHRVTPNKLNEPRVSVNFRVMPPTARPDNTDV